MSEQLDLTTPITYPNCNSYVVSTIILDWTQQIIRITLTSSNGATVTAGYQGTAATALMTTLNTANLSTTSLHKRILQKLQTDGFLPVGTVTGTPS